MIEPFFFDNGRLFGSYSAATDPNADTVVVICSPLFDEYRRTYRALSELSMAMAARGVHAFRFDYYGTADSQGLLTEATIDGWLSDIDTAINEAVDISGADQVVLLGVRFGAMLAAQSNNPLVRACLFWDPIVSGERYLAWLQEIDDNLRQRHHLTARANHSVPEGIAYQSFVLSPRLISGMRELTVPERTLKDPTRSFTVTTDPEFCRHCGPGNCTHPGLIYDWPLYHDGVITHKPVLEALLAQVDT